MNQPRSADEVLAAAMELSDSSARSAYLDRACAGDPSLRQEVESLLAAAERAGAFLESPATEAVDALQGAHDAAGGLLTEKAGSRLGRYKLLEQIGEGGFGVVWMAEQEEPVRRRVALKIIKLGMDTREVVARFEAERQALAMMDHPNIASIFDGGATDTGRPYFVMELVKGIPITTFCDERKLFTRERLELFMQVCYAVQHAHQKGVIHRDLKPSNVLVTVQDDRPVPKVIDFGVAKATQARLTEKTLFTRFQQWIGTPAYMSPEQAGLGSLDVDTRSDVYSLGVLLYELLTGQTPIDTQQLLEKGYDAVMRTIREEEATKPSTRISTLAEDELKVVAAKRGAEPANLNRQVRGDLDWVVMMALEKDRARRYETPSALARDIQRHLGNEPVLARPPSSLYRFQKMAQRNRLAFTAGTITIAALVVGFGVSTWLFLKERKAYERAVLAEREQSRLRQKAEIGEKTAGALLLFQRGRVEEAERMIKQIPPSSLRGALQSITGLDAFTLLTGLGDFHASRGEWPAAVSNLELIVEIAPTELLDVDGGRFHEAFSSLLVQTGDLKRYREHCQLSLARTIGTKDPLAAERVAKACLILPSSGADLAAVSALEEVALTLGRSHRFYSFFEATKGWIEYRQGHFVSAVEWLQRSLANGSSLHQPGQVAAYMIGAMALHRLHKADKANELLSTGLKIAQEMPPPDKGGWDNYYCDWIIAHVLIREAQELIQGIAPSQPNSATHQ